MGLIIDLDYKLADEVQVAAKEAGVEPETYVADVLTRHLHKKSITVSEPEVDLLQQINLGLSDLSWQRYYALKAKLEDKTLQPSEQQELIAIADQIEKANVGRISALFQLAELRNTTDEVLMDELNIRPPAYA